MAAGLVLSVILIISFVDSGTRVRRAQHLSGGMSRVEVRDIMGLPNHYYTVMNKAGTGVEKGDCFDRSQSNSYYERYVRPRLIGKLGYMPTYRTASQYPIEIKYDDKENVVAIRRPEEP